MQQESYSKELGATAACTRRLCESAAYAGSKFGSRRDAVDNGKAESFMGDSWFTGIRTVEWAAEQGHSYFGALKTSTKCTPYQELIDKMRNDYPSGAYLVMECTTPNGHDVICLGYKYSASKVLVFLGTKSAGPTTPPGEPYIARFPDANGNVAQRSVPRPAVISNYFKTSNVIDSHNQARQGEIALEKRWVTQDCWFRLVTTLIGMTITDCWRAFKQGMPQAKNKDIQANEFADQIAYDCIHNCHSDVTSFNGYLATTEDDVVPQVVGGRMSDISSVTEAMAGLSLTTIMAEHPFMNNPEREQGGNGRPIRRNCRANGCTKTYHKMCFHPRCREFRYVTSKGWVKGVFYCSDHYHCHYAAVLEGNNNV
jgi:hypothetical protein